MTLIFTETVAVFLIVTKIRLCLTYYVNYATGFKSVVTRRY